MAIKEVKIKINYVAEASAPLELTSETIIGTQEVSAVVIEDYSGTLTVSVRSVELLSDPNYSLIEFDGNFWKAFKLLKLYGSPSYDYEIQARKVMRKK